MSFYTKFRRIAILGLAFLHFTGAARAHRAVITNITLDIEMNGDLLVIEPWVPTFLLPPLEDITFENLETLPNTDERQAAIEEFFDTHCPVEIDGVHVKPVMQKLALQPMEQAKYLNDTIDFVVARIVLHYQAAGPPKKMKLRWSIYPPIPDGGWGDLADEDQDPQEFDNMMFVDNKEDYVYFSPQEPEFLWHRRAEKVGPLNVITEEELAGVDLNGASTLGKRPFPVGSLIAAGLGICFFIGTTAAKTSVPLRLAGPLIGCVVAFFVLPPIEASEPALSPITETQSVEIFKKLQANLYSAFDFDSEDEVYDVLAQSVDGKLLDDIYTEVYQSLLVLDKLSTAMCKVHEVEVLEISAKAIEPDAENKSLRFDIACHWRVHGVVKHFEHIHRRVNEYRAEYRLTRKPDGWKISGVAVSEQQRLDPRTMKPSEDYQ